MSMDGARIRVTRAGGHWRDVARGYKVLVDGTVSGVVHSGQTCELSVAPGPHVVRLTMDRFWGSADIGVSPAAGETAFLTCQPGGSALAQIPDLIKRRPYISLSAAGNPT